MYRLKIYTKAQKHACFHVLSPFSAHLYPHYIMMVNVSVLSLKHSCAHAVSAKCFDPAHSKRSYLYTYINEDSLGSYEQLSRVSSQGREEGGGGQVETEDSLG